MQSRTVAHPTNRRHHRRHRQLVLASCLVLTLAAYGCQCPALFFDAGHLLWEAKGAVVELILTVVAARVQRRE
jgi:hypothetical protein